MSFLTTYAFIYALAEQYIEGQRRGVPTNILPSEGIPDQDT